MLFGWFFCVYTPPELEMGNSVEDNAYLFPIKYMGFFLQKAALKCIREMKARKRDLTYPLYCKICTSKQFTAAATLMYHYRSHAGKYKLQIDL